MIVLALAETVVAGAAEVVVAATASVAGNVVAEAAAVEAVIFAVGLLLGTGKGHMTEGIRRAGAPGHPRYSSPTWSPCGQRQQQHTNELDSPAGPGGPGQPAQEGSLSQEMLHREMHSYLAWGGSWRTCELPWETGGAGHLQKTDYYYPENIRMGTECLDLSILSPRLLTS